MQLYKITFLSSGDVRRKENKNSNTSLLWIWCVIYIHGKIVVYVKSIQWHTHEVKTKDSRQIGATNMQSNNHWNYHLNRDTIHHSTSHANNSCKRRYQLPSLISVKNMGKKKLIKTTPTILCNFSTNFPCLVWTYSFSSETTMLDVPNILHNMLPSP